jgi:hypothetical protein
MHVTGFGGGHTHSDWLSFLYAHRGRTIISERGIHRYGGDLEDRDFRLGRAHNILQIGERDAIPHGKTMWDKWVDARVRMLDFKAAPSGKASWTAEMVFLDRTRWRRTVRFDPQAGLVIEDELRSPHRAAGTELRFHLNTVNAKLIAPNACVTTDKGLPNVRIRIEGPPRPKGKAVELSPVGLSPSFTRREEGLLLCYACQASNTGRWVTVVEDATG